MSGSEVGSMILGFLVVTGISFLVICLVASLLRFQGMTEDLADSDSLDPEGGRKAWVAALAARLSAVPTAPAPFSVLWIAPRQTVSGVGEHGHRTAPTEALQRALRPRDRVFVLEDGQMGVLLAARRARVSVVLQRLRSVGVLPQSDWAMGLAAYPEDGGRVDPLLEAAGAALQEALRDEEAPFVPASADGPKAAAAASTDEVPAQQGHLVDEVTGALIPERLVPSLQKLIGAARRDDKSVSLLVFRVEHLSRYRDHYGADAVRALLRSLGETLRVGLREEDLPVRIDDDQVGAIAQCGGADALKVASRLSEQVRGGPVPFGDSELKMAVQVGVATAPGDAGSARELIECASRAADAAVAQGRGACVRYDAETMASVVSREEAGPEVF